MSGYAITTYKMKLFCKTPEWITSTKILYNQVQDFYYDLFLARPELWDLSSQNAMRSLEVLTLTSRTGEKPEVELPFKGVSSYFRRSAINTALAIAHSYLEQKSNYETEVARCEAEGLPFRKRKINPASNCSSSPVFYKGMYKDFGNGQILLKLWTGTSWCWVKCKYRLCGGRPLPEDAILRSPTLVVGKKSIMLHVPVEVPVPDVRKARQRMNDGENVCGICFTNYDAFAVCTAYTADGRTIASRFIRGGDEYVHHSKRLLARIKANRQVMGKRFDWTGANKGHWKHLNNLSDYWAHKVSRQIVDFCVEYNVKTIAIGKYDPSIMAHVVRKKTKYTPLYLALRIKKYLSYKAWQQGIIMTEVWSQYTSAKCSICKSYLVKQPSHVKTFRCKGGHTGNKDLNTARNLAMVSLKKFGCLTA